MKTTKIVHDIDETFGFQNRNLCDAMKNNICERSEPEFFSVLVGFRFYIIYNWRKPPAIFGYSFSFLKRKRYGDAF